MIVVRFDREALPGYVDPQSWLRPEGMELLNPQGSIFLIPYADIKAVCYVRGFEGGSFSRERRQFMARPRSEGLWVRMLFRDGDYIDGVLPNSLLQLDAHGFMVTPPDPSSNNQRLYIPRAALKDLKILGVIGSPLRRGKREEPEQEQYSLFG